MRRFDFLLASFVALILPSCATAQQLQAQTAQQSHQSPLLDFGRLNLRVAKVEVIHSISNPGFNQRLIF